MRVGAGEVKTLAVTSPCCFQCHQKTTVEQKRPNQNRPVFTSPPPEKHTHGRIALTLQKAGDETPRRKAWLPRTRPFDPSAVARSNHISLVVAVARVGLELVPFRLEFAELVQMPANFLAAREPLAAVH